MSKKRILIVEDEALTVLALKHELAELGYEITSDASTAADALRVAEDNRADLVLIDIQCGWRDQRYCSCRRNPRAPRHSDCVSDRARIC
jgi:CheY-like chemotaxis protein